MKRPVTILSGYLGSGKTTLLNQLLRSDHGLRIALMINDFGDINIDKDLVVGGEGDLLELSGGCMCCTVREDLLVSARMLADSGREFDCLIVETSGLADPAVVAKTFLVPGLEEHFRLDAVVTVIDGANIEHWLEISETALEQIKCADLLVVNKLDLIDREDIDRIKRRVTEINPAAEAIPAINGIVPSELLLDLGARAVRPAPAAVARGATSADAGHTGRAHDHDHGNHHAHDHHHHQDVVSATFDRRIELEYGKLDRFIRNLPDSVIRAKCIVAVRGFNRRVIIHRVGHRNVLDQGEPWGDEARCCRGLFIGSRDLDRDDLLAEFENCKFEEQARPICATTRLSPRASSENL